MKPGGGKGKGSSFERYIAKELSLWWTEGKNDKIFWRTHSSGMIGTVSKITQEYGDIMAVDKVGQPFTDEFSIECRIGKALRFEDLIYRDAGGIWDFIKQGEETAVSSGRKPLWFFKENRKEILMIVKECLFTWRLLKFCKQTVSVKNYFIIRFKNFLKTTPKEVFVEEEDDSILSEKGE